MSYKNTAKNEIIVNSIADLPNPVDLSDGYGIAYHLEAKAYNFGTNITLNYPIIATVETGKITFVTSSAEAILTFTMSSGGCFLSNSTTPIARLNILNIKIVNESGSSLFDIDGAEYIQFRRSIFSGVGAIGVIKNTGVYTSRDSSYEGFNDSLKVENCTITYMRGVAIDPGQTVTSGYLVEIKGTFLSTVFTDTQAIPVSGDALFNFDSGISGRIILNIVNTIILAGGIPFYSGSLDQTDPKVDVKASPNIPDSEIHGGFFTRDNTTQSTITEIGIDRQFQSASDAGGGQVQLNSTDTSGLSNGQTIWITDDHYNGKFTISNLVANTSFEITATFIATSSGDIQTGWVKVVGTTIADELNEQCSMPADNELLFANIESSHAIAVCNYSIKTTSVVVSSIQVCIMNDDVISKLSIVPRDLASTLVEGITQSSVGVINGNTVSVFTRNLTSDTRHIIMEAKTLIIH